MNKEEVYIICEKILSKECYRVSCDHAKPHYDDFIGCCRGRCSSFKGETIDCVTFFTDFFSEEEFEI